MGKKGAQEKIYSSRNTRRHSASLMNQLRSGLIWGNEVTSPRAWLAQIAIGYF